MSGPGGWARICPGRSSRSSRIPPRTPSSPGSGRRCWPGVSAERPGAIAWDVSAETPEGQARALLAGLLDWHRREDKPAWWRYFYLRTLSPAELTGEPDALGGLTGGDVAGQVTKSVVRRFRLPPLGHPLFPRDAPS